MSNKIRHYDVIIVGAGPAGTTCALALKDSGLNVALLEKGTFPRDKICGDAIPGPALKILDKLLEDSGTQLSHDLPLNDIQKSIIYTDQKSKVEINWATRAINSKRIDFDNFLYQKVLKNTETETFEECRVTMIERSQGLIYIYTSDPELSFSTKIILGADGAKSTVSRFLNLENKSPQYDCFAVRAYYQGVDCESDTNEFSLLKNTPGYFWIFPVGEGVYNVGIGIVGKEKTDLKSLLFESIDSNEPLKTKFAKAKLLSDVKGFMIPMGGQDHKISGDHYMLLGDAAYLVDPLQGHGIDKAMKSALFAAEVVKDCFELQDFSHHAISSYDQMVSQKIGKELKRNYKLMKLLYSKPGVVKVLSFLVRLKPMKALMKYTFYKL